MKMSDINQLSAETCPWGRVFERDEPLIITDFSSSDCAGITQIPTDRKMLYRRAGADQG